MHHLDMKNENNNTCKFGLRIGLLFNIIIGVGLLGFSIFFLLRFQTDNVLIIISTLMAAMGLTTIFLTINYLTKSLDLKIRIDQDKDEFEIITMGKKHIYKLTDVASIDIREQRRIGFYGFDFDFAKYTFNDGKYCVVTNMMTNGYYIPVGLEPKISKRILPIIWGQTNF